MSAGDPLKRSEVSKILSEDAHVVGDGNLPRPDTQRRHPRVDPFYILIHSENHLLDTNSVIMITKIDAPTGFPAGTTACSITLGVSSFSTIGQRLQKRHIIHQCSIVVSLFRNSALKLLAF